MVFNTWTLVVGVQMVRSLRTVILYVEAVGVDHLTLIVMGTPVRSAAKIRELIP